MSKCVGFYIGEGADGRPDDDFSPPVSRGGGTQKIKLHKNKFDLMRCINCKHISAYKAPETPDGRNCPVCGSPEVPIGRYRHDAD